MRLFIVRIVFRSDRDLYFFDFTKDFFKTRLSIMFIIVKNTLIFYLHE